MLDNYILELMKFIENDILTNICHFFSFIGSFFSVIIILYILKDKKLCIATFFCFLLNVLFKNIFKRQRPISTLVLLNDYSFPSGHAMIGTFLFGYIFIYFYKKKKYISIISLLTLFMIIFSRVYLLAHYLTDVIAGLVIGLILLITYIKQYDINLY